MNKHIIWLLNHNPDELINLKCLNCFQKREKHSVNYSERSRVKQAKMSKKKKKNRQRESEHESKEHGTIHLECLYAFCFGWLTQSTHNTSKSSSSSTKNRVQTNAIDNMKYENCASIKHTPRIIRSLLILQAH